MKLKFSKFSDGLNFTIVSGCIMYLSTLIYKGKIVNYFDIAKHYMLTVCHRYIPNSVVADPEGLPWYGGRQ